MGKQKAGEVCEVKAKNTLNCVLRLTAALEKKCHLEALSPCTSKST
jgi:hypothetical protein